MKRSTFERGKLWVAIVATLLGLIALGIIFSGCASSGSLKAAQGVYGVAQAADVHSTYRATSQGVGVEGNPLLPSSWWAQSVVKGATTAAVWWIGAQMEKQGHTKLAIVMTAACATATAIVAGRNYQLAR